MSAHVVILGAGFGGLELCTRLAEDLPDDVHVTLIDQRDSFVFGFSKLDVMFGRQPLAEVRSYYRDIAKPTVTFKQETVTSIDPVAKRVVTDGGTYDADILVVALGADYDLDATPGLREGGYEFYSPEGADAVRSVLPTITSGHVVISVLGPFFKCPPAPNETAFMLHDLLVARGVRDAVTIHLLSTMGKPIPVSADTSDAIMALLDERDIKHRWSTRVVRLDPDAKVAHLEDGSTLPYDLFLGIPVHCAPPVCVTSGLTEDDGWIAVDPRTLATKFPDVYAVGDCTSAPVPRAGVIAEGEATTVADVLVHRFRGGEEPAPYPGLVTCYVEMGDGTVGRTDVTFLAGPTVTAVYQPPSRELAAEKKEFGRSRRARWFGP
jgi:sulfide:quinone oxidoreductase